MPSNMINSIHDRIRGTGANHDQDSQISSAYPHSLGIWERHRSVGKSAGIDVGAAVAFADYYSTAEVLSKLHPTTFMPALLSCSALEIKQVNCVYRPAIQSSTIGLQAFPECRFRGAAQC